MTALTSAKQLLDAGLIAPEDLPGAEAVGSRYSISVTDTVAGLIDAGDPADPIGDHAHSPVEGIVHRYPDRVLLKAVHVCPVYCRFCFRREMVGPAGDGTLSGPALDAAIGYIAAHPEIWEVIITGGDPLVLSPRRLHGLMQMLGAVGHVRIVRFHSRVPVTDPARIDRALIDALNASGKTVYVALHANHPRELTEAAKKACAALIGGGIAMVSQSVLLKGINDDPVVLADLMRRFVEMRVKPYYLHHPDLAPGTGHFRMPIAEGRAIVAELRRLVSGLCMPAYILDIPGGHGKVPLHESPVTQRADGCYAVEDRLGVSHRYDG